MNLVYHPHGFDHTQRAEEVLLANPVLYSKISSACEIEAFQVPQSLTEVIRFLNLIAFSVRFSRPATTSIKSGTNSSYALARIGASAKEISDE